MDYVYVGELIVLLYVPENPAAEMERSKETMFLGRSDSSTSNGMLLWDVCSCSTPAGCVWQYLIFIWDGAGMQG